MCAREEVVLVTTNMSTSTRTHTRKSGSTGRPNPTVTHEREGVKTDGKQNGCIPNESKQLIIYAYWEFLRTESSRLPVEV